MPHSPAVIASQSDRLMIPFAQSIAACASDPSISSLYIRRSKGSEVLKSSSAFPVGFSVRPAQSFPLLIPSSPPAHFGAAVSDNPKRFTEENQYLMNCIMNHG